MELTRAQCACMNSTFMSISIYKTYCHRGTFLPCLGQPSQFPEPLTRSFTVEMSGLPSTQLNQREPADPSFIRRSSDVPETLSSLP